MEKPVILIRYGELALKSKQVRLRFEKQLVKNIKSCLQKQGIKADVKRIYGRILVKNANTKRAVPLLKKIFGIVSFSYCYVTNSTIEDIKSLSLSVFKRVYRPGMTFKVDTKRVGNHPYTSQMLNEIIGENIVKKYKAKVNLSSPERILYIDVRDKRAYIFWEKIPGPGGFPIGTQGKVVSVIESENGIVSTWLIMKRGALAVPFFVDMNDKMIKKCVNILKMWNSGYDIPYYKDNLDYGKLNDVIKSVRADAVVFETFSPKHQQCQYPVFYPLIIFNDKELKEKIRNIIK